MKTALKFVISLGLGIFLFSYVLEKSGLGTIGEAAGLFLGLEGLFLLFLTCLIVMVGAVRWKSILRAEGEEVPLMIVVRYLVKGFTVDFLTPFSLFGGEAVRIYLMKKEVGLKKSASSSIIDKIMDVTTHFLFLLFGLILLFLYTLSFQNAVIIYGAVIILVLFIVLFFFYLRAFRKESIVRQIFKIFGKSFASTDNGKVVLDIERQILYFFSSKKKELFQGMTLSFLRHFLFLSRTFFIIYFLIGSFEAGGAVVAYGLTILSMLLPIPASLGSLEMISAVGFGAVGMGFAVGTSYAIAIRTADLFVCFFGLFFFARLSWRGFLQKIFLKKEEEEEYVQA